MFKFIIASINHGKARVIITVILLTTLFASLVITTHIMQDAVFNNYKFIANTTSDYWLVKYPMAITNQPIFTREKTNAFIKEVSSYAEVTPLFIIAASITSTENYSHQSQPLILSLYRKVGAFTDINTLHDINSYTAKETTNQLVAVLSVPNNNFKALDIQTPSNLDYSKPFVLAPLKQRNTSLNYDSNTVQMLKKSLPIRINNMPIEVTGTYDIDSSPFYAESMLIVSNIDSITPKTNKLLPFTHLMVKLKDKSKLPTLKNAITNYFPTSNLLTKKQYATNMVIVSLAQVDTRSLFLAGIILLITSIVIISTTFQIFIRDQQAIYSMLQALGVKRRNLLLINAIEVFAISFLSAIVGLLLGSVTYFYFLTSLSPLHSISILSVLIYFLMVTFIAALSIAIPYKELSKISPDNIFIDNQYE